MVLLNDIWREVKAIVGHNDEPAIFERVTSAVELLANKGDYDPLLGYVDICVSSQCIALPREVETVLGLSMAGVPAIPRDQVFRFHRNGPGHDAPVGPREWMDFGQSCTFRDIECPARLVATCRDAEDAGKTIWVYGTDQNGNELRTKTGGVWETGLPLQLTVNTPSIAADAPQVARITRVRKPLTVGPVALTTSDNTMLGLYQHDETEPLYRRIKLSETCSYASIFYRGRTLKVTGRYALLPVNNSEALLMMLRALKLYRDEKFAEAEAAEATALRWMNEEQKTSSPVVENPIQFSEPYLHPADDHVD